MPPVKDEQTPTRPVNTSSQIQQIFSEIQSQLPSVNFDNDDHNDDADDDADEDVTLISISFVFSCVFHFVVVTNKYTGKYGCFSGIFIDE